MNIKPTMLYPIKDVAKMMGVTPQCIYVAIKKKPDMFPSLQKIGKKPHILGEDALIYIGNRYKRSIDRISMDEKEKMKYMFISKASKRLKCTKQRIYYLTRLELLAYKKVGGTKLVLKKDIQTMLNSSKNIMQGKEQQEESIEDQAL